MDGWVQKGQNLDYITFEWSPRKTFFVSGNCFNTAWFADNYCDDVNNVPECGYDGGDCCTPGEHANCDTAEGCTCLDCNSPYFGQLVVDY